MRELLPSSAMLTRIGIGICLAIGLGLLAFDPTASVYGHLGGSRLALSLIPGALLVVPLIVGTYTRVVALWK